MKLLIFIFTMLMSCTACNSNGQNHDSHDSPDLDHDSHDLHDEQDYDTQDNDDPDETPDEVPDVPDEEVVVECLDLRDNKNTVKTPFPFKDKNGRSTFCRPGCDTPTENDPQCVRNIWEWDNWEKYQEYLAAQKADPEQTSKRECYPWPCKLPDMKANANLESFNSKCDRWLTVNNYSPSMGVIWSHGMSDGVAGMNMGYSGRSIAVEYDPEKDEYIHLGKARGQFSFSENRYVVYVNDRDPAAPGAKNFIISIERRDGEYYYELIHDDMYLLRPSFSGKKWVFIQGKVSESGSNAEVQYAKAGDWEWHNIEGIMNYAGEGNIVGDHLTFITDDRDIYYCDLRKYPGHINDCVRINRHVSSGTTVYEKGHSPRIDAENEKRLVYNVFRENRFVEVNLTDVENPVYSEYEIEKNKETGYTWQLETVRGSKAVYAEMFTELNDIDSIACFYRFDKKKVYCPKEDIFSTDSRNIMGYNTFWGKWHLWKRIGRPSAVIRDLECYCEETGICPLLPPFHHSGDGNNEL